MPLVRIDVLQGRTADQLRALGDGVHAAIARNLAARPGVRAEDVFVNLVEVAKENWSFGDGIAQYAP
jgi:4-oxalocrotonate tautomerase